MIKLIKITFFSIIFTNVVNVFCDNNQSLVTRPIWEVNDQMPGWEKQIIENYCDEERQPLPVIFRGEAKNWKAAAWTPEYFANQFGNAEIVVVPERLLEEGVSYDNSKIKYINTRMEAHIKDIILNSKNACYFVSQLFHNMTNEELLAKASAFESEPLINAIFLSQLDLETETRFPQSIVKLGEASRSYAVFIGSENTITSLHNHGSTFLSQIYGKKLVTLIHPKYIKKCYCTEDDADDVFKCAIDIINPNFEKYPELKNIEIYQAILEPSDILYIPEGWLHDIRALSTSINIGNGF